MNAAGILPAVESTAASPRASALSNVLLDGFTSAPVCGNDANCTGGGGVLGGPLAGSPAQLQKIANQGLPPRAAAALLAGLGTIKGATTIPVYSPRGSGGSGKAVAPGSGPGANAAGGPKGGGPGPNDEPGPAGGFGNGIISCAGLRELAVLGQCAPGLKAAVVQSGNMFDDNPRYSTQPIASASSPAASASFSGLYLQAVLGAIAAVAAHTEQPDAELRANLIGTTMLGIAVARHVLEVEPIASLDEDALTGVLAGTIGHYLSAELK